MQGWKDESGRHSLARHGISTTQKMGSSQSGKIFDVTTAPEALLKLKNGINAPYVNVYSSTLGGEERISILITISLETQDQWSYKILENSPYIKMHLLNDGRLEHISGDLVSAEASHKAFISGNRIRNNFRKAHVKSIDDAIRKINVHLDKSRQLNR